jgi:hypothetical protein
LSFFFLRTKKRITKRWYTVVHSSSTVAVLTTESSLWTCACAFST